MAFRHVPARVREPHGDGLRFGAIAVTRLTQRFHGRVTRYGTGGFPKARLDGRPAS